MCIKTGNEGLKENKNYLKTSIIITKAKEVKKETIMQNTEENLKKTKRCVTKSINATNNRSSSY